MRPWRRIQGSVDSSVVYTLTTMCVVVAHKDWEMHSVDISNAFLYGSLGEVVYLQQALEFDGLYGLHQAPKAGLRPCQSV